MARCWSCGAEIPGGLHPRYWFTCPNCAQVEEIESLRREASDNLTELARIQEHGFETLSDRLSEVATVIEWGFEDIKWELRQQTDVLRSIDHTLKTPSETQANEWRRMAEEMRMRGVLDKSEELFLKALDLNPLDYRIYLGLAQTYLRMNQFKKAKTYLEESIPHAPKSIRFRIHVRGLDPAYGEDYECEIDEKKIAELGERKAVLAVVFREMGVYETHDGELEAELERFGEGHWLWWRPEDLKFLWRRPLDYRSYCYRLIGHIYACEENYVQAAAVLKTSVELSPEYEDAHYDYAQYCALTGRREDCLASLRKAILARPLYFHLAQKERNFEPVKGKVGNLLRKLANAILQDVKEAISLSEKELEEMRKEVSEATSIAGKALQRPREVDLECVDLCNKAESQLQTVKDRIASREYLKLVEARDTIPKVKDLAIKARERAVDERKEYEKRQREEREEERKKRTKLFLFLGGIGLSAGGVAVAVETYVSISGMIIGIIMAIAGIFLMLSAFGVE